MKKTANTNPIYTQIIQVSKDYAVKDIARWRKALRAAEDPKNPDRSLLLDLYDDLALDNHFTYLRRRSHMDVTGVPFQIFSDSGQPHPALTALFHQAWFRLFLQHAMDSLFFGHTLLELALADPAANAIRYELIPRKHVLPHIGHWKISPSDQKSFPYRSDTRAMLYLIEVGPPDDLGLLNRLAPIILFKKLALLLWAEFSERFGMPLAKARTNTRDLHAVNKLENFLRNLASRSYAIIDNAEDLEFVESVKTDAFQVFDKLIERCNSEMSKAVRLQTLTADPGHRGARSLGEVHLLADEDVAEANRDFITDLVNEVLLPQLAHHGFPTQGCYFQYLIARQVSDEQHRQDVWLHQHFDIDPEFWAERYGVPIKGRRQQPGVLIPPGNGKEAGEGGSSKPQPSEEDDDQAEPPSLIGRVPITHLMLHDEHCCAAPASHIGPQRMADLMAGHDDLLHTVWNGNVTAHYGYQTATANALREALWKAFTGKPLADDYYPATGIDYNTPDYLAYTMMEANLLQFSAAKTVRLVQELNALARDHNTFDSFKAAATPLLDAYTLRYLNAEYNHVWATGQNAAEYHRMKALAAQYPYWQYLTAGDGRVREAHRALHGKVFRHDDPVWNTIYPPNGWNCRCYVKPLAHYPQDKLYTEAQALNDLASTPSGNMSELDRMRKGGFDKNRAELKTAFTESQMYIRNIFGKNLGHKAYNLPPYEQIDRSALPDVPTARTREDAIRWYEQNVRNERIKDYAGRSIIFSRKTLEDHLKKFYTTQNRQDFTELIGQILSQPDEVWFRRDKQFGYHFIKFFKDFPVKVFCELSDEGQLTLASWHPLDKKTADIIDKNERNGILIKRKR